MEIIFVLSLIIPFLCLCICMAVFDMNFFLSFIIAMVCFGLVWLLYIPIHNKEKKNYQEQLDNLNEETKERISKVWACVENESILTRKFMDENDILMILSYDFEDNNLKKYLLKDKEHNFYLLNSLNNIVKFEKPNLQIIQLVETNYEYNEEKLVYTSATVGFVTTGGFHKEGGDYSSRRSFTGKYAITEFDCVDYDREKPRILNKVYLNSELLEKARKSNVAKYTTDDGLFLQHSVSKLTHDTLKYASSVASDDYTKYGAFSYAHNLAKREMALTKEECQEVRDWLLSNMI